METVVEPEKGKANLLRFREGWSFPDMVLYCGDPDKPSAMVPGQPCQRVLPLFVDLDVFQPPIGQFLRSVPVQHAAF